MALAFNRPQRWVPLLTGAGFFFSAVLALAVSRGTDGLAPLWPANGILLAALLLAPPGRRAAHVIACLFASIAANLWGGESLFHAVMFTVANLAMPLLAAMVFKRLGGDPDAFRSGTGIWRFVVSVAIAVAVGASIAAGTLAIDGIQFGSAWQSWASSDLLGSILVTSIIVAARRQIGARRTAVARGSWWSVLWPFAALICGTTGVFVQSRFPLLFVPFALVLLTTYRLGRLGAVGGTGLVALIGAVLMAAGHGPVTLATVSTGSKIQFFQFYLTVMYATCLWLATLLAERTRSTREQAESARRHRRILDRSRDVIFETDMAGRWTYLNPAWHTLAGRAPEHSLGQSFLRTVPLADHGALRRGLAQLFTPAIDEYHQELRYVHADGSIRWASVRSHLLTDENGATTGAYGTLHDVTDAKAAEAARTRSEHLYRLLADNSNDMIVRFDLRGVRLYVSPACEALLGYAPEELVDGTPAGEIHPDDREIAVATCRTLLTGAENPIATYRQRHRDGHYVWLEASYRLIRDSVSGEPVEFIASVRDIGRRQQAELDRTMAAAKLHENNRLLQMAEEMGRIGHWRVDLASQTAIWSDVVCAIHGVESGHMPALASAIEVYHPDDRARVQSVVTEALASGQAYELKARIVRADGDIRHVVSRGRPEKGPEGSVVGLVGVFQDVTDAQEAQEALRAASELLTDSNRMLTMAEAVAHLGHWRMEGVSGSHFWSEEVYRIHGLPSDYVPAFDTALDSYHPDDRDRIRQVVHAAVEAAASYSFPARVVRPDGSVIDVLVRGEMDLDDDGQVKGVFGIIQDVSEQAAVEALLRDREQRFRLITEQASDMISVHDFDGRCRFMSPAVRSILGYDPDDMLGHSLRRHLPRADRLTLLRYRLRLQRAERGTVVAVRFRMRHADGRLVWIEALSRQAHYDDRICLIAVCRDVSDQVAAEAELQEARAAAEAGARVKSLFLANMSHEIRTPMNGVIGFTELLLASTLTPEQRRQTELIADSGRAMMGLLNDILDLSKVEAGLMTVATEPFDLCHTLKACIKLVTPAIERKGLTLHCDLADDLPRAVSGDGLRLRQIILNLLGNAAKFTVDGSVTLRAAMQGGGSRIVIAIEDTGIGIARERQAAIFEQFVQADTGIAARFGGTGLGLAISSQLAGLMGGKLEVESQVGRGTCFTLTVDLPATDLLSGIKPALPASEPRPADPTMQRILVAEDHDVNQLLIGEMLSKLGHGADMAEDGIQAIAMIERAQAEGRPYRLVLMDMQMPGMDGVEATRRLRASGIDATTLPIVATTANAYADDVAACLSAGMQAHLSKPINMRALRDILERWLAVPELSPAGRSAPVPQLSAKVQERYRIRKADAVAQLSQLVRAGHFEDADLSSVQDMLHKLAGTAEMFGDGALGDEARLLEIGLQQWPVDERPNRIRAAVRAIQGAT